MLNTNTPPGRSVSKTRRSRNRDRRHSAAQDCTPPRPTFRQGNRIPRDRTRGTRHWTLRCADAPRRSSFRSDPAPARAKRPAVRRRRSASRSRSRDPALPFPRAAETARAAGSTLRQRKDRPGCAPSARSGQKRSGHRIHFPFFRPPGIKRRGFMPRRCVQKSLTAVCRCRPGCRRRHTGCGR